MRVVFMGTPDFAAAQLRALIPAHRVVAVVTQPDRPRGRGHAVAYAPVKALALAEGLPVLQPVSLRKAEVRAALAAYEADVFAVAAYGLLLPPRVLALPRLGCVNVHASLLPKYRGAAPIQYALLNGDTATGITIIHMARGMDTGDMLLQRAIPVAADERFPTLHDRLAALGAECLLEALAQMESGTAARVPQQEEAATYAPMIAKEDGHINWGEASSRIVNLTRALDPWPGPFAFYEGQALKIWDLEPAEAFAASEAKPGTLLSASPARGLVVKTGDGALRVTEVQAVGGKRMKAADYLRGHAMTAGTALT